jgi:acyl-CoA thioesterase
MPTSPDERRAVDATFLGLTDIDGGVRFTVERRLARPDLRLFGGTAIAVALAAIERTTGRDAVWATAQLVGTAPVGTAIDCAVDELARGRRTSQVRITATAGDEVAFVALGAAAALKDPASTVATEGARMPVTPPPDACKTVMAEPGDETMGWHGLVDMRMARERTEDGPGRMCLWLRLIDGQPWTAARLAFVADMMPVAVCRAAGITGAGTSLDNSLRVGHIVDTEWVLVDLIPHVAWGGYGTGTGLLWGEDGTLLAVASQTATVLPMDFDPVDPAMLVRMRPGG